MPDNRLPSFPEALAHIWADFGMLKPTKLVGMAAQQITWAEINAYSESRFAGLSAWDKLLIRRLDDAYEMARPDANGVKPQTTNVADMKGSLRAAVAARAAAKAAAAKGEPT